MVVKKTGRPAAGSDHPGVTGASVAPARGPAAARKPVRTVTVAIDAEEGDAAEEAPRKKAAAKKAPAKKAPAKKAAKKAPAKKTAKKAAAKKTAAKGTAPAKKTAAKKAAAEKAATGRTAKKTGAGKVAAKKTAAGTAATTGAASAVPAARTAGPGGLAVLPGEDPWTPQEVDEARAELLGEVERLTEGISSSEAAVAGLLRDSGDGAGDDEADTGTKNITREYEMALAANTREMLAQTRHALERLDEGTYGLCESCGNPIGKARMQAFPRATLCLDCKQKQERR
ncbi:TraR/DksA family transcriptional regulator [Streptomyces sp. CBMA29]|uniref:TraR/DksA family transcriptional regulator n=1 Tax=Streptomyces sp. CBMA29 TaxID=1896314 RepID=UPI001661F6FB|nr:TraR/DksA family transcriptional regulator [Streptomyces sp. CBMA29]MBD0736772.1 DNA-binding protein [Streptomyces sp. CBMA29]